MNDDKTIKVNIQENSSLVRYVAYAGILVLAFMLGRASTGSKDYTDGALQPVTESATSAGQSVNTAGEQIRTAQSELDGASTAIDSVSERIGDSKATAESNAAELDELTRIAKECRDRNKQITKLFKDSAK